MFLELITCVGFEFSQFQACSVFFSASLLYDQALSLYGFFFLAEVFKSDAWWICYDPALTVYFCSSFCSLVINWMLWLWLYLDKFFLLSAICCSLVLLIFESSCFFVYWAVLLLIGVHNFYVSMFISVRWSVLVFSVWFSLYDFRNCYDGRRVAM